MKFKIAKPKFGIRLSSREKKYIKDNAGKMVYAQIAINLNRMYPEDNGGTPRTTGGVRSFAYRLRKGK